MGKGLPREPGREGQDNSPLGKGTIPANQGIKDGFMEEAAISAGLHGDGRERTFPAAGAKAGN